MLSGKHFKMHMRLFFMTQCDFMLPVSLARISHRSDSQSANLTPCLPLAVAGQLAS